MTQEEPGPQFTPSQAAADCKAELHPQARLGIQLYNHGEYFEAHEALETAWRQTDSPARELYRGILQVAVACHHARRGNYNGAVKLLARALRWLQPFPDMCRGINVEAVRQDARWAQAELETLGPDRLAEFNLRRMRPIALPKPGKSSYFTTEGTEQ